MVLHAYGVHATGLVYWLWSSVLVSRAEAKDGAISCKVDQTGSKKHSKMSHIDSRSGKNLLLFAFYPIMMKMRKMRAQQTYICRTVVGGLFCMLR